MLALAVGTAGCKACSSPGDDADASAGPTMPRGMLVPSSAPTGVAAMGPGALAERVRLSTAHDAGSWVELTPTAGESPERGAPGARWLSPEVMALLHDAFSRAQPGFDPFRPHRLDAPALRRLDAELAAFAGAWGAISTASSARAGFEGSELVQATKNDEEWRALREALLRTVDELRRMAVELAGQGRGLWVLGG